MERARTEWLRSAFGLDVLPEREVGFVVQRAEIDYLSGASWNDQLDVTVKFVKRAAPDLVFDQERRRAALVARCRPACRDWSCSPFQTRKMPETSQASRRDIRTSPRTFELWQLIVNASFTCAGRHAAAARGVADVVDGSSSRSGSRSEARPCRPNVRARVLGRQRHQRHVPARGQQPPRHRQPGSASSRPASASSPSCGPSRGRIFQRHGRRRPPRHARHLPARDGRASNAHLSFLATVGSVSPTSACSAPCGASCMPSAAWPTCSRPTLAQVAPGHCRSADRHRHRPVRRDSRRGGLQPLLARHRPPGHPLRKLHGGVFQHPPEADARGVNDGTTHPAEIGASALKRG